MSTQHPSDLNRVQARRSRIAAQLLWPCLLLAPFAVRADESRVAVVFDRARGELSPGTDAPDPALMVSAIGSASPTALSALLEYGERVECLDCIPLLESKLLGSDSAKVREMAAWWLRKRAFGYGRAAVAMRRAVLEDPDVVHRSRAAEALGEFLDAQGQPALAQAALHDAAVEVRLAAVRALGRLNAAASLAPIASAFTDADPSVRRAALEQVLRVNHWTDAQAVLDRLGDDDAAVRQRAAQLAGELRLPDAVDALIQILSGDAAAPTRQAAAWALGRIGGQSAHAALGAAQAQEQAPAVQDAIEVALHM